ncbi:Polyneuridine-aldehyde esterase, partial [Glycine soja]
HFVLVHGGLHGAWCWYKVVNQLKSAGHNVTTLDLAAAGINPKQVQGVNSFSEYNEPLITFLASLLPEEKVILVGHSLVFVTATVVSQNLTFLGYLQEVQF